MTRATKPQSTIRFILGGFTKPTKEACEDFDFTTWTQVGKSIIRDHSVASVYSHYPVDAFTGIIFTQTAADLETSGAVNNDPCVLRTVEPTGSGFAYRTPHTSADYAEINLTDYGF